MRKLAKQPTAAGPAAEPAAKEQKLARAEDLKGRGNAAMKAGKLGMK